MSDRRFKIGCWVSVGWVLVAALILWATRDKLSALGPNEWGDYLAGVFAPLAFLWLVLGYMQQGEELRLQAVELQNSVEQQRQLVEVTRLQVEAERMAFEHERSEREAAMQPRFVVVGGGGSFRGDGQSNYRVSVTNIGALATNLKIEVLEAAGTTVLLHEAPFFGQGAFENCNYKLDSPLFGDGTRLSVRGADAAGRPFEYQYNIYRQDDQPTTGLSFGAETSVH